MDPLAFSENDTLPLHKVVYKKIRQSILSGAMKPGEKIVENEISKRLSISKTPIREALRELSQEGLVIHHTRKGISVIDFKENDVKEILILRAEIEAVGIRMAVAHLGSQDHTIVNDHIDRLAKAAKKKNIIRMAEADMEFHNFLMQKSGNSRLVKAWKTIASQMQVLLMMIDFFTFAPANWEQNHRALLKTLLSGDAEKASASLKSHILTSMDLILKQFHSVKNSGRDPLLK